MIVLVSVLIMVGGVMLTTPVDESEKIEMKENLGYLLIGSSGGAGLYNNNIKCDDDCDYEKFSNRLKSNANIQYSLLIAGAYMLYSANESSETSKEGEVKEKKQRLGDRLKELEDEFKREKKKD